MNLLAVVEDPGLFELKAGTYGSQATDNDPHKFQKTDLVRKRDLIPRDLSPLNLALRHLGARDKVLVLPLKDVDLDRTPPHDRLLDLARLSPDTLNALAATQAEHTVFILGRQTANRYLTRRLPPHPFDSATYLQRDTDRYELLPTRLALPKKWREACTAIQRLISWLGAEDFGLTLDATHTDPVLAKLLADETCAARNIPADQARYNPQAARLLLDASYLPKPSLETLIFQREHFNLPKALLRLDVDLSAGLPAELAQRFAGEDIQRLNVELVLEVRFHDRKAIASNMNANYFLLLSLSNLMKLDGEINPKEIERLEQLLAGMTLPDGLREDLDLAIHSRSLSPVNYVVFSEATDKKQLLYELVCLAKADGRFVDVEQRYIREIGQFLEVPAAEVETAIAEA